VIISRPSRLPLRGALRGRQERWGRGAVDVPAQLTNALRSRTAKSCGPDPPMLGSTLGLTRLLRGRWLESCGTPRRPRISRNPSRGECRVSRLPSCYLRALCISLSTQGPRVRPASGIPRALCFEGDGRKTRTSVPRERGRAPSRCLICESPCAPISPVWSPRPPEQLRRYWGRASRAALLISYTTPWDTTAALAGAIDIKVPRSKRPGHLATRKNVRQG